MQIIKANLILFLFISLHFNLILARLTMPLYNLITLILPSLSSEEHSTPKGQSNHVDQPVAICQFLLLKELSLPLHSALAIRNKPFGVFA